MSKMEDALASGQVLCGCLHLIKDHDEDRCREIWRYPDVLNPRPCGCTGPWRPKKGDSRYGRWVEANRRA